ncbi:ABC transporter ATP-binding protein [Candidatus Poribacteria bacterium]|nr:ABC transporter ATP-binding protein [Candidatus Poribacteria bacterium]MYB65005.1 ABC transporter ATP-binding protein [Candidatus Poribacteria bacterium]MYF56292.1 ABC transporter ATP-binding protein [Candidatus Poribacteria bacterium]MYI94426.1 ABC transporter ATP-binding protein [Candidatus Poribacteria bacterium]
MLKLQNIHTYYGNIRAVRGISIEVNAGEKVCMIGANGAGKSTTQMTISGIYKPVQGTITFDGMDITRSSPEQRVKWGISQVPEGRLIFPDMTVLENLELGAYLRKDTAGIRTDLNKIYEYFPILFNRRKQRGGSLSGGEQQMLAIGRSLMSHPTLLLLDEPSLGLAPLIVKQIFEIIQQINEEGTTILLVEQNAQLALNLTDRGYVMETGEITIEGNSTDLLADERVRQAYLGE